jgi:hypothetical protein
MAFVSLPELDVVPSEQTYTHIARLDDDRALVRYASGTFESQLTVSPEGIVEVYPKLGARLVPNR